MRDPAEHPTAADSGTAQLAHRAGTLARTAHAGFIPAIARLHRSLQATMAGTDAKPLLRALQDMRHAVGDAHCEPGGPRWLRWLPGRRPTPPAGTRYPSDCRESLRLRAMVAGHAEALALAHPRQAAEAGPLLSQLLELTDRLDVPVQEGLTLLATSWDALRRQRPDPADPGQADRLRSLLADADAQRALLQRLEGTCSAARDVVRLGRAVLSVRETLLLQLGTRFDHAWHAWRRRVDAALQPEVPPALLLAIARDAWPTRRALLQHLEQARAACTRLQIDEQAFTQALVHLGGQLGALGDAPAHDDPTLPSHRVP